MKITVQAGVASGEVIAPPSKSMAHRHILAAALAEGQSLVRRPGTSRDVCATIACVRALGATCEWEGEDLRIVGTALAGRMPASSLPCGECGTTLRLLIPVCLLMDVPVTLTGSPTLLSRPLGVYRDLARTHGFLWEQTETALTVKGCLTAGDYTLPGDVSSQFISGLLFALPLTDGDSTLTLTGKIESRPYIDLTLATLRGAGIDAAWTGERILRVRAGRYRPTDSRVAGDWSNAVPWLVLQALGDPITVRGLDPDDGQGDKVIVSYLEQMRTSHATLSVADCPDLAPYLMAYAALQNGVTLTHTARLGYKESDRAHAMQEELAKCGVRVEVGPDTVTVHPVTPHAPAEAISSHNDHRIAMATSLILSRTGGELDGAESVNKSYPSFFDILRRVGIGNDYANSDT